MSRSKKLFLSIALCMLALPAAALALAQSPVTAEVDRTSLTTDESLILTIRVNDAGGTSSEPVLPALDGFRLDGSASSRSIRIENGVISIETVYQYRLAPTRASDLTIEPITVEVDGQPYSTNPISIHVMQGTGQPQPSQGSTGPSSLFPNLPGFSSLPGLSNFPSLPDWLLSPQGSAPVSPAEPAAALDPAEVPAELTGQDLFVESKIGNLNPYQGEGLLHKFRFYQAVELFEQPEYQPPAFTGFWHEQASDMEIYTVEAAGRTYRVTEIQTSLFPTVVGDLEIEPARLAIPGGFFQSDQSLATQPLHLTVKPLPADAPPGFMGAVGQFDLSAEVDKTSTQVNDTVTQVVTLSGSGNLETAPDPVWTEGDEWRAFDSQPQVDTYIEDGQLSGSRRYQRLLVPTTAGDLTLPGLEYVYFNPQTGAYETANTDTITVQVSPDGSAPAGAEPEDAVGLAASGELLQMRPNKQSQAVAGGQEPPLPLRPSYWLLWVLPLLFLAGQSGWLTSRKRRLENPAARRSQAAAGKARRALRDARAQSARTHSDRGGAQAQTILLSYLEDKLGRPLGGLTERGLADILTQAGLDNSLTVRVSACLRRSDLDRYAPKESQVGTGRELLDETGRLINEIERSLG